MLRLRPAKAGELAKLNDLCVRSKAVWGYDEAFMTACKTELTLTENDLEHSHVAVAEVAGKIVAMVQVKVDGDEAELHKMFVEPDRLKTGAGRALFEWACGIARERGATSMLIDSDPNAAPFYRHMGARDIGLAPSGSIPGRMLPRLAYEL